jgi:hypothetical protein
MHKQVQKSNPINIPTKDRYLKPKNKPGQEDTSPEKTYPKVSPKEPLLLICMKNMDLFSPNGIWNDVNRHERTYQIPK